MSNRSPSGRRSRTEDQDTSFEHQDDANQDKAKILRNILWLLPIALASILIIMGSLYIHLNLGSEHIHSARNVLARVSENLRTKPFFEAQFIEKDAPCGDGFELIKEISNFGGIEAGCVCKDGTVHTKAYCVLHSFSNSCGWVKATPPPKLKNFFATKNFCVKRNSEWKHEKSANCGAAFKAEKCFTDYCISTNDLCPVNSQTAGDPNTLFFRDLSINHSHASTQTHSEMVQTHATPTAGPDQTITPTPPGIKVQFDPTKTDMPFIGFEVVTGANPCWDTKLREKKQSGKSYPLLIVKEIGCGEFNAFENNLELSNFQTSYKAFYTENDLGTSLPANKYWADFFDDATDQVSLRLIRKIKINGEDEVCYSINPSDIDKLDQQIETLKEDINGIFIAVISVTAIMLLIALIFYIFKDKTFYHFDFKTRSSTKVLIILGIVSSILVIAGGIVYFVKENTAAKFQAEYQKYIDKKCFIDYKTSIEAAIKTVLKYLADQHGDLAHLTVGAFYTGIAFIVTTVIALILKQKTGTPVFDGPFQHYG